MRTKQSDEFEQQESTWIYLLHQQAPPQTRLSAEASLALPPIGSSAAESALFSDTRPLSSSSSSAAAAGGRSLPLLPPPAMILSSQDKMWTPVDTSQSRATTASPRTPGGILPRFSDIKESLMVTPKAVAPTSSSIATISSSSSSNNGKRACFPKKCDFPMCKNSSRSRGFCYSHGGGRRCRVDGCNNGAVSRDLCKRHGGGRRCRVAGCKSSSESGGLCYSHGGGRRCSLSWCSARAKKGGFCAVHLHGDRTQPPATAATTTPATAPQAAGSGEAIAAAAVEAVHPNVVETLLSLAKDHSDVKQEVTDVVPTTPSTSKSAYAIASLLN
ncbi:hypothetical protein PHYBOEH_000930 [Phytophthora boehmeriae]|uniref:WRKY19-like zinc finger domain-containing protein n=1 Tax=Phytophthora boehmeriae TaxID=109152 RepID=A0A8T1WUR7_9STRA|nr:hypothetical protein PHYBOEH_000930 [Phytophthora boehmeriae]